MKPGSADAEKLKQALIQRGIWSQYLEVGIGPYAEVFTKSQPMSGVGTGADIGIHPESSWNNPEPEVVLAVNASGTIVGATLGNDVNLRDFEGRSALLLGRAKDNNASCALGPFIRLFDGTFALEDLRQLVITVRVDGPDQFVLDDSSSMAKISRDVDRSRVADPEQEPPISGRLHAVLRHHVRADQGSRRARGRASPTRSATS